MDGYAVIFIEENS